MGFQQATWADWVWLAVLIGCGAPVVWQTVRGMAHCEFAADVIAMLAIVTTVIMHEYFAGVIIVIMQTGGEPDVVMACAGDVATLETLAAVTMIFAFHGYPLLIHWLTYRRTNHHNLHVRGYKGQGTTTTPFDMVVLNDLDRFHLVGDVIDRVPSLGARAA